MAMDFLARRKAQQRADRIRVFREELAELEREQALSLMPDQRSRLDVHLEHLLAELTGRFGVDVSESSRRISWGMRIAALLGCAAFCAALVLFLHRVWGALPTAAHVGLLVAIPLVLLAVAELTFRRNVGQYYTALLVSVAVVAFVMQLSSLGTIFNLVPSPHALLAWGGFAVLLAYAYGLRLPLGAGLLLLCCYTASLLADLQNRYWVDFLQRPESLIPAAVITYLLPFIVRRPDRHDFAFIYRVCGAALAFVAMLVVSISGYTSFLALQPRTIETLYQFAGLLLSAAVVCHGIRSNRSGIVNLGALAFVVFLYVKFYAWWWEWMPKYLFFLLIGVTAVVLLIIFRRLRARLVERKA